MNAHEQITTKMLEYLNQGIIPWKRPWRSPARAGKLRNACTNRPYSGINIWILSLAGYEDPRFLTYRQATTLGGHVLKGEKGTTIYYAGEAENEKGEKYRFLKGYAAFCVSQCYLPGLAPLEDPTAPPRPVVDPIMEAENIIAGFKNAPTVSHGHDRAAYSETLDRVFMPPRESFISAPHYYATLFHELSHTTGHQTRLNRFPPDVAPRFGSDSYSEEELIAEMATSILLHDAGIDAPDVERNAGAYIQSWGARFKEDHRLLARAARAASRAAEYIHPTPATNPEQTEKEVTTA